MRQWGFVQLTERCGQCGALIPEGAAAVEIVLHSVKRKRYRGECCAGPAPEFPAVPVRAALPKLDISRIAALIPERTRGEFRKFAAEWTPYPKDRD